MTACATELRRCIAARDLNGHDGTVIVAVVLVEVCATPKRPGEEEAMARVPARQDCQQLAYVPEAKKAPKKAAPVAKTAHYDDVNIELNTRDAHLHRLTKAHHRQAEDLEKFFGINDENGQLVTNHVFRFYFSLL